MKAYKYQANGNSFILFYQLKKELDFARICHPHFGLGADGVLLLYKKKNRYELKIINADGSLASMCGNGLRVVGKFLKEKKKEPLNEFVFVGDLPAHLFEINHEVAVELPYPSFRKSIGGWNLYEIGNLHLIKKVEVISEKYLKDFAMQFPSYNCSVYQKIRDHEVLILTSERGVGLTLSCGSASLSTFIDYKKENPFVKEVIFHSRGGVYKVMENDQKLCLVGNPKRVWKGEIDE